MKDLEDHTGFLCSQIHSSTFSTLLCVILEGSISQAMCQCPLTRLSQSEALMEDRGLGRREALGYFHLYCFAWSLQQQLYFICRSSFFRVTLDPLVMLLLFLWSESGSNFLLLLTFGCLIVLLGFSAFPSSVNQVFAFRSLCL